MNRRAFLTATGAASLAGAPDRLTAWSVPAPDFHHLFKSKDPKLVAFAERVMQVCVLDRVMPPTAPLENRWIVPGGPHYKGQWIWDTMFVVDLLGILPGKETLIREIFRNYWDFQDRWNAKMPEYAHDMVTVAIKTDPQPVRQFS